ncbi:aurora kinase A-interacting protein [Thalassophryne amazonica]|uniref:aurora kinase A-interacting protein n=1 Tax=Thalassophryne amazonica TaxID=390379 RepID=UPI0014714572|nr:aurora kinase A-interacting protein [Thalassophryne amazonica]XP_034028846.1 aurora kinase A-interacting protein [Thalassophryne amazonica]XP_034028847.1 aurora kinase A-interacting protein [Thalassophryne amazonica]
MFTSKVVPRLPLLRTATCAFQTHVENLNRSVQSVLPASCCSLKQKPRTYSTAADSAFSSRWVHLEPDLDEALVPRKLSLSPLETWLSLRYSLPPLPEATQPQLEVQLLEEKMLPPLSAPALVEEDGTATPLSCKNVLKIRRRKMNRHRYKKLRKRTKFLRKRVEEGRGRRKQKLFEADLKRIWKRAGLKNPPEGWITPNLYIKNYKSKSD